MMQLSVLLFILSVTALCSADYVTDAGPCKVNVKTDHDFDLAQFASENGGSWKAVYVVNTSFNSNIRTLTMTFTSDENEGEYKQVTFYRGSDGSSGILPEFYVMDVGGGIVNATSADNYSYTIKVIDYVQGRYLYYYICSDDAGTRTVDVRYVLTNVDLTPDEISYILGKDKGYKFKGDLIKTQYKKRQIPGASGS